MAEKSKKTKTELVFILDRSGSMGGLESDTVGGYNAMMEKQKDVESDITVTTVLFDDCYELLHDRVRYEELSPMTEKDYFVRGGTALIDAIGKTIIKIENAQRYTAKEHRANKVIFVITTDGFENSSKEFRAEQVKKMVTQKREKDKWEFIFLGANIDAVETAEHYGFARSRSMNFCADRQGLEIQYNTIGDTLCCIAECGETLSEAEMIDYLAPIAEDYEKRKDTNL
jgi:Uncharacterized protein encoded in toxicity protection region of plasmid R478, contains von Willebrand factor (vWF) domain